MALGLENANTGLKVDVISELEVNVSGHKIYLPLSFSDFTYLFHCSYSKCVLVVVIALE